MVGSHDSTLGSQVEGAEYFGSIQTPSGSGSVYSSGEQVVNTGGTPTTEHSPVRVEIISSNISGKSHLNKRIKEFSEERLDFSRVSHLYGRDKEIQQLEKLVNEVLLPQDDSGKDRCFLIVEGVSGCGKSALVGELRRIIRNKKGLYCKGKFDFRNSQPLFAIKTAMTMLVDEIFKKPVEVHEQIKTRINEELASEIFLLARFIPDLLTLAGREASENTYQEGAHEGGKEAMDQFNFSVRKLTQIITSVAPVVLVCDDLQWSDQASRDIMKTLLTDVETRSLMVVGVYRKEMTSATQEVSSMIEQVKKSSQERSIAIETIDIDNLTEADLKEFLADLLSTESSG